MNTRVGWAPLTGTIAQGESHSQPIIFCQELPALSTPTSTSTPTALAISTHCLLSVCLVPTSTLTFQSACQEHPFHTNFERPLSVCL